MKRRRERPEVRRGKEVEAVERNIAHDVQRPCAQDPWKGFSEEPHKASHRCPHYQAVCDVITLMHVSRELHPAGIAYLTDEEWAESKDVRSDAEKEGSSPVRLVLAAKERASPKSVGDDIH